MSFLNFSKLVGLTTLGIVAAVIPKANAAYGNYAWLEPDDSLRIECNGKEGAPLQGAFLARIEVLKENEEDKSFLVSAQVSSVLAVEVKGDKQKEKFKHVAKDGYPFGKTVLALRAGGLISTVPVAENSESRRFAFQINPPFMSGDKNKKEVKSISIGLGADSTEGVLTIDKSNFLMNCAVTMPKCTETGSSGSGNGYGSHEIEGCREEGPHKAKRYRAFRAFKTDMKDNLQAEMRINSYDLPPDLRVKMEDRLRNLGSSAHGMDGSSYLMFLNRLEYATNLPDGQDKSEMLEQLRKKLIRGLTGTATN